MKLILASIALATIAILGFANNETHAADPIKIDEKFKRLDPQVWDVRLTEPGSGIGLMDGALQLLNRPYVLTKAEFKKAYELSLDWQWAENGGGRPYAETFLICLRTSGETEGKRTWELTDGLQVRIVTGYGLLQLQQITGINKDGKPVAKELAKTYYDLEKEGGNEEAKKKPSIPPKQFYKLLIKDDGSKISFFFNDDKKATLEGEYDQKLIKSNKIGFGTREFVAGKTQSSAIKNVVVTEK